MVTYLFPSLALTSTAKNTKVSKCCFCLSGNVNILWQLLVAFRNFKESFFKGKGNS